MVTQTVSPPLQRASPPSPPRMTEEAFVAWCDEDVKAEWVDGEVIEMTPSSVKHVRLAGFLLQIMGSFARHHRLGEVLGPECPVRLAAQRTRRVPDLLFVARERADIIRPTHIEGPPDLVVEIVSPESVARDWREKYLEYEAARIGEYWVVDPMAERVEAYALNEEHRYAVLPEKEGRIESRTLPGFFLQPAWLWQEPLPNPLEILKTLGVL